MADYTLSYTASEIEELLGKIYNLENIIDALNNKMYPVGSIFMSTKSENPVTYLEFGTWVAWGSGRVPVGVNTSDSNFSTVEKTGGASTHTLTETQIPSHSHTFTGTQEGHSHTIYLKTKEKTLPTGSTMSRIASDGSWITEVTKASTEYLTPKGTNSYTGGSQAHNNLQPYITCYMWKRTA